jgi:hypothetical protein
MDLVGSLWICERTLRISNIVHTAALWSLWKVRNDICFNRSGWHDMQVVFRKVAYTLAHWEREREKLRRINGALEALCAIPAKSLM